MSPEHLPVPGVAHREVHAGGMRWHVAEAGDGPPVVLLHGWPQHWWMWRHVQPALAAAGLRVLAPDLPGHGWSDAPRGSYAKEELATAVLALLDALALNRVALVGHDWGGFVAQLVAVRAPQRVTRLAALDIVHLWSPGPRVTPALLPRVAYQPLLATPGVGPALLRHAPGLVGVLLDRATTPATRLDAAAKAAYAERLRDPGRARATAALYRTFLLRELPALQRGRYARARLRMPALLATGAHDPVIVPTLLDGFTAHADAPARTAVLPGCGHFGAEERPAAVLELLEPFLRGGD